LQKTTTTTRRASSHEPARRWQPNDTKNSICPLPKTNWVRREAAFLNCRCFFCTHSVHNSRPKSSLI
jgi:hypothetical protein